MKRFIPVLGAFSAVILFLHWAVYEMLSFIWPALVIQSPGLRFLLIALLGLSFIVGSVIVTRSENMLGRVFYTLSAYWLGLFVELLLAASVWSLVWLITPHYAQAGGELLTLVALLVFVYGSVQAKIIRVKTHDIRLPNIPASWRHKRVVMLSDLHLGAINGKRYAKRVLKKLQALEPDIVFLVGDFFDGVKVDKVSLARTFSPLAEKIYFVTGNHDGFTISTDEVNAIRSAGIHVLENEALEIDGVQILGVDYRSTNKSKKFHRVLEDLQVDPLKPSILLKHVPLDLDLAAEKGISLVLSGHTHNGQIFPGNLIAKRAHKGFNYGLRTLGTMQVLVSSGVGTWGPPLRIGTGSEIVVMHFL